MRSAFYTTEKLGPKQSLTPEGFLLCAEVPIARTGMMIYGPDETPIAAGPDGIVKIFREPEDVFTSMTIASAQGKPVTNDHPMEDVTPENWKELTHGTMMNVRRGEGAYDDLLIGDLLITTPEGIEAVRGGKIEVSLGYEADYEETGPGVGKQANLIINHIALVEQGRCGPRCAISDSKPSLSKGDTMTTKTAKKPSKILDALMRAFKAKDAEEVERLAEEVADELPEAAEGSATHIHVHTGSDPALPMTGDSDPQPGEIPGASGHASFTDEDLQAHIDQNAAEHAEMRERIEMLEKMVSDLTGHELASHATPGGDEEAVMPEEAMDEIPEELKENAMKAKDSAYLAESFQDTVAKAEILVPGIRIPTFDRAAKPGQGFKKICGFRRQALDLAYAQPATRGILDDILAGKSLDTKNMTCDAVRTLFNAASAARRNMNNTASRGTADTRSHGGAVGVKTLADLNRLNAEHFSK